ncbi:MAG TPA: glycosyltransferase family 39 protein [Bacteroidia bacterium]|nr:glycosyltransferase family 39 protein [Bacteroidia bacterium]
MPRAQTLTLPADLKAKWYTTRWWPYFLLAATCAILYSVTLWYGFSPADERWIITAEKRGLSDLSHLPALFKAQMLGLYYRPLLNVSFMMDMLAGNGSTFNFHLTNVLLHIVCSLLLFRFFVLLGFERINALLIALIFAVHPINVQAVAWVPGRNDTLLTAFVLLSCIFLLRYITGRKIHHLVFHLLFFACALFTKESAILLPAIFLLLFLFFAKEKRKTTLVAFCGAWILIPIAWWLMRIQAIENVAPFLTTFNQNSIADFFSGLLLHAGKILLPVQQSVMPLLAHTILWPYAVLMLAIAGLVIKYGVKNKNLALLGLVWFFIIIALPAWTGAVNGNGEHYEHRVYTALPGALLFLSQVNIPVPETWLRRMLVLLILALGIKTIMRLPVYKDEFSYAKAGTIEVPSNSFFHDILGTIYLERKDYHQTVAYFNNAIQLNSNNADYYSRRGEAHGMLKNYENAIADDTKALSMDSTLARVYLNRGIAFFHTGDFVKAKKDIEKAAGYGAPVPPEFVKALSDSLKVD